MAAAASCTLQNQAQVGPVGFHRVFRVQLCALVIVCPHSHSVAQSADIRLGQTEERSGLDRLPSRRRRTALAKRGRGSW